MKKGLFLGLILLPYTVLVILYILWRINGSASTGSDINIKELPQQPTHVKRILHLAIATTVSSLTILFIMLFAHQISAEDSLMTWIYGIGFLLIPVAVMLWILWIVKWFKIYRPQ